jgi:hypothetical protein
MKPIILIVVVIGAYLVGRSSAPEKVIERQSVKTVQVEKLENNSHKVEHKRMVIKQTSSGDKEITLESILTDDQNQIKQSQAAVEAEQTKEVLNRSKILLQAFGGVGISKPISYGLGVSYRVIGPILVGAGYMQGVPMMITVGVEL